MRSRGSAARPPMKGAVLWQLLSFLICLSTRERGLEEVIGCLADACTCARGLSAGDSRCSRTEVVLPVGGPVAF